MIENLGRELKFAFRSLLRTPLFSISTILILALGCAATTTIFSIINVTLLKRLPYSDPDRIVDIYKNNVRNDIKHVSISPGDFEDLKASTTAFSDLAYSTDLSFTLTGMGPAASVNGYALSSNFLPLLGVEPLLGRIFLPTEGDAGTGQVVLLSYGFWQTRFGGNQNVLDQLITLDGEPHRIIGIMPREFQHPGPGTELWVPLKLSADAASSRAIRFLHVVGRLAPGMTLPNARAQLDALSHRLE